MNWIYDRIRLRSLFVIVAALGALSMCVRADAGTITSTWRAPSLYTDGSTIASPISYRVEVGPEGQAPNQSVPSSTPSVSIPNIAPGRWCVRIYAVVAGVESDPTAPSCVSVPGAIAKKPNPAYGVATTAAP